MCDYKYALGKPGEGAHVHVGGIAIVDVALTGLLAVGLSHMTGKSFVYMIVLLLIIATALHYAFCVPTAVSVALGLVAPDVTNTPTQ